MSGSKISNVLTSLEMYSGSSGLVVIPPTIADDRVDGPIAVLLRAVNVSIEVNTSSMGKAYP